MDRIKLGSIALVLVLFACEDPNNFGLELEPSDPITVSQFAEFVLPSSNVFMDSLRTDNENNLLIGSYSDSVYGTIDARSWFRITYAGGQIPSDTLFYDSTLLTMEIEALRLDAPVTNQRIFVYELLDTLFQEAVYLKDKSIPLAATPIDTLEFALAPDDSVLFFELNNAFGREIFDRTIDEELGSITSFEYSLAFVPDAANDGLISIDITRDTTAVYVYTLDSAGNSYRSQLELDNTHFINIQQDRSGSSFSILQNDLDTGMIGNGSVYLYPLAGIYPTLELEPLLEFIRQNPGVIIQKASFELGAYRPPAFDPIDAINAINFRFRTSNGGFDGSGILTPGLNLVLSDAGYLANNNQVLSLRYDDDDENYEGDFTLFAQILLENFKDGDDFVAEDLVIAGVSFLNLEQTTFLQSELKVKLFYTALTE
ncbi:MAG: DUF4270 family protein [Cyclobacteriaceae bacterium]|nr:DUF4270 family protein [Cyclobacteriaceae bacterium HetDA_MAG_MS6]